MITNEQAQHFIDSKATVYAQDGDKIGSVVQVYLDDATGTPNWVTVKTGLFGSSESFVPVDRATVQGEDIHVPYSKDMVKDAPRVEADHHLSVAEEDELYSYYGLETGTGGYDTTGIADTGTAGTAGTGYGTDTTAGVGAGVGATDTDRDASVVRSEEKVDVGTRRRETGKARLRKFTVTENVTKTVPVTREEVRIEREPITDADTTTGAFGDDEAEVTLHEDEVVTEKETVPVERVSLDKDTVTEDRQVTEEVRKEQVDTDIDRDRDVRP
ncbi:DUF2382 domain-containing protein [Georgenia subflava]|uniref:DUF2382 domain-containing protein n=1 Tax=Georgenia subflava TaxID=1622177 RepID=A0A6N7ELJ1_9MICO|nr:PRC and DUF2382 domain-containing protein [Georgenia subflava]MPV38301.1 DUF2382 domain-containing protein [Georgenia subflava]